MSTTDPSGYPQSPSSSPNSGHFPADGQTYASAPSGGQAYDPSTGIQPYDPNAAYAQGGYQDPNAAYAQGGYQDPNAAYAQGGYQVPNAAYAQGGYQDPNAAYAAYGQKSKVAAGLLGIFLGSLGIHNFYLGHTGKAVAQLLISVLSFGLLAVVSGLWGLIEGILILSATPGVQPWGVDSRGIPLSS